jgi:hypothetical protein
MFKDLLNSAKSKFDAHQRAEEIRHLDIDPEEYVMLRDDKSPMAVELLKAILEKLNLSNWEVDERTSRIVRVSEIQGYRKNWSIALTSDTRRFHLKIYRDFEGDLEGIDLVGSRGICAAISFVETAIQELYSKRIREVEIRRLAIIEEEKRRQKEELARIQAKVNHVNDTFLSIYGKELSCFKLGEAIIDSATRYISDKVDTLSQVEISLPIGNLQETIEKFAGEQFKIIDDVPCKLDEATGSIKISNCFIKHCVIAKNHIEPKRGELKFNEETKKLVIDFKDVNGNLIETQNVHRMPAGSSAPILSLSLRQQSSISLPSYVREPVQTTESTLTLLQEIANIASKFGQIDASMTDKMAKITVLDIASEVSSFRDLIAPIDNLLSSIAENVSLIEWNSKNSAANT